MQDRITLEKSQAEHTRVRDCQTCLKNRIVAALPCRRPAREVP
jgi:hypothetical protein